MGGWVLGVIGGSGLYEIEGLANRRWVKAQSPWGEPSDELLMGEIGDLRLVFLPRHGRGHRISPTEVNSQANIDVLKRAGCTDILSVSAVGSLREELAPGHFVLVDQYIDRTFARPKSFFGTGLVAHVSMADPTCPRLSGLAAQAARAAEQTVTEGGTLVVMEGPQFSTRAESELYRSWGADLIGMTAMPEAKLAREAELPYATLAMVTDYDCWREETAAVEVSAVMEVMAANADGARATIRGLAQALQGERPASLIDTCLDYAVVTSPSAWDPARLAKLDAIGARRFKDA
jgi:5'-methylthioadenosine phosphorylase